MMQLTYEQWVKLNSAVEYYYSMDLLDSIEINAECGQLGVTINPISASPRRLVWDGGLSSWRLV